MIKDLRPSALAGAAGSFADASSREPVIRVRSHKDGDRLDQADSVGGRVWLLVSIGLLLVAGAWLRWPFLRDGLWRDEASSVYIARASSLKEFIGRAGQDYNPPLFTGVLALFVKTAGYEESALKAFGFFIGMAALISIVVLAFRIGGPGAALLAAALAASHPLLITMAAEVRPYSLTTLLAALALASIARLSETARASSAGQRLLVVFALILLAYAHYCGTLAVVAIGSAALIALVFRSADRAWRTILAGSLAAGALLLFWAPSARAQLEVGQPWRFSSAWSTRWPQIESAAGHLLPLFPSGLAAVILLGCAPLALFVALRITDGSARAFALSVAVMLSTWLVFGLFRTEPRYFTVSAGMACAVAAALPFRCIEILPERWRIPARRLAPGVIALLVFIGSTACERRLPRGGVPKSGIRAASLQGRLPEGGLVVAAPEYLVPTIWYYGAQQECLRGFARWEPSLVPEFRNYRQLWTNAAAVDETLDAIEAELRSIGEKRFWIVSENSVWANPLRLQERSARLVAAAAARFDQVAAREFPGYFEPVIVTEFSLRREEGEPDGARRPVAAPSGPRESASGESRPQAPGQR